MNLEVGAVDRLLVETAPVLVVLLDLEGRVLRFNRHAEQVTGLRREDLLDVSWLDHSVPEDQKEEARRDWRRLLEGPTSRWGDLRPLVRPDGEVRWIDWNNTLVRQGGEVTGVLSVGTDVTQQQRAEQTLQLMAEHTPDVFWMATPGVDRILYVSPGYEQLWGRPVGDLAGDPRAFVRGVHPDDLPGLWDLDTPRTTPWENRYRVVRPDGDVRWVRGRGFPVLGHDGQLRCFAGTVSDITEQKQNEQRLARRADLADLVAAVAGQLAAATTGDLDDVLRRALERIGRAAGADRAAVGEIDTGVLITHEWHSERVPARAGERIPFSPELLQSATDAVVASGASGPFEMPPEVHASGLIEGATLEMVPLLVGERMFGVLGVSSVEVQRPWGADFRVALHSLGSLVASTILRVRAERTLRQRQRQLRRLSSRLALAEELERRRTATILHDEVGQELALLKMRLGMIGRELDGAAASQVCDLRERLSRLIEQTRAMTADLAPPALFKLGLPAALEALGSEQVSAHGLALAVRETGTPLPLGEGQQLFAWRAVRELLTNTLKYAEASRVVVTLLWGADALELVVDDDGCGFEPRVLDPESGAETVGFGLIQLRERLHHMGGSFEVGSQPGEGTRVTMLIPVGAGRGDWNDAQAPAGR